MDDQDQDNNAKNLKEGEEAAGLDDENSSGLDGREDVEEDSGEPGDGGQHSSDDLWDLFSEPPMTQGNDTNMNEPRTAIPVSDDDKDLWQGFSDPLSPPRTPVHATGTSNTGLWQGLRHPLDPPGTPFCATGTSSTSGYTTTPISEPHSSIVGDFSLNGSVASSPIEDFSDNSVSASNSTVMANEQTSALMSLQRLEDAYIAGLVEARDAGLPMAELDEMISPSMRRRLEGMGYRDEERPAKRSKKGKEKAQTSEANKENVGPAIAFERQTKRARFKSYGTR